MEGSVEYIHHFHSRSRQVGEIENPLNDGGSEMIGIRPVRIGALLHPLLTMNDRSSQNHGKERV